MTHVTYPVSFRGYMYKTTTTKKDSKVRQGNMSIDNYHSINSKEQKKKKTFESYLFDKFE